MTRKKCVAMFVVLSMTLLVGCGKAKISDGKIDKNTIAVNKDGTTQIGMVNDFSKGYYNEDELETFINDTIKKFQATNGSDSVKLNYIDVKDDKAYVTLEFPSVDKLAAFDSEDISLMSFQDAKSKGLLNADLIANTDNKEKVSGSAITEDDCKVLVLHDGYRVLVEGDITYYSGGTLVDSDTVDTVAGQQNVILFK